MDPVELSPMSARDNCLEVVSGHAMKRAAVRLANKTLARALAAPSASGQPDLEPARQAAHALLVRSMKMGHRKLAWRRLETALRLGLVPDDETQRYFTQLRQATLPITNS